MILNDKLDIFDVLKNINNKNFNYINDLSEDKKKMFSPYVVFQWLSSSNNPQQIMVLNHINRIMFKLQDHPTLIYKLFCISSVNKFEKYNWIYKKEAKDESTKIISEFLGCSFKVAKLYKKIYNNHDIQKMAKDLGYQDREIKDLKL